MRVSIILQMNLDTKVYKKRLFILLNSTDITRRTPGKSPFFIEPVAPIFH